MMKQLSNFIKRFWWFLFFLLFLFLFARPVFLKGYLIGPFDFLAGFYHPFSDIDWGGLKFQAIQYKTYQMSDVVTLILPIKLLVVSLWRSLKIPLWNPYILNGSPLLANVQSAVFYPLTALYCLLDSKIAYNIYILSQPLLAFLFMFLFLKSLGLPKVSSLFGGLSFSFSSFMIVWLAWGTVGHSFLWLPLIFYCLEEYFKTRKKRYGFLIVLGLVASFLAGHTQTAVVVWGLSFLYLIFKTSKLPDKKPTLNILFLFLIASLISSIQALPSYEMYRESVRNILATKSFYQDQTLYFSSYLQSLFPDLYGNPVTRNWWGKINYAESAIYFGTISIYFLIYLWLDEKRFKKPLFSFFTALLSLGILLSSQNFFSRLVFNLKIPLILSSTFARYSMIYIFSAVILSSFGFYFYLSDLKKKHFQYINLLNILFFIFLAIFWALILTKRLPQEFLDNYRVVWRNSLLPTALIMALISVSICVGFISQLSLRGYRRPVGRRSNPDEIATPFSKLRVRNDTIIHLTSVFIIFLLSFELFRFSTKYMPFSPPQFFYPTHPLIEKLQQLTKKDRYYRYLPPNMNAYFKIKGVEGLEPLYNLRLGELASLSKEGVVNVTDRAALLFADGKSKQRVLDLFSVKYFVDRTDNFRNSWGQYNEGNFDERFTLSADVPPYKIYENKYVLPRQNVFYKAEIIKEKDKILKRLVDNDYNHQNTVILEEDLPSKIGKTGEFEIEVISDDHTHQEYKVETSQAGVFVVTDTHYPGWKAFVDGKGQKIIRANYAFRGLYLPKGESDVVFKYEPESFKYGIILTTGGLISLIIYLTIGRFISPKIRSPNI